MISLPHNVRLFYNTNGTYTCQVNAGYNFRVYQFQSPPLNKMGVKKVYEGESNALALGIGEEKFSLEPYEGPVLNIIQTCLFIQAPNDSKIPLAQAQEIAQTAVYKLEPLAQQIEIAGSVRRCKAMVKDIEIVVVPKQQLGANDYSYTPHRDFVKIVDGWIKRKGEATGKYTQRIHPANGGTILDIFIACPANFGLIMIYRTGSREFNLMWIAHAKRKGYAMKDGFLWKGQERIDIRTEQAFFRLLGLEYMEPQNRNETCKLRYL